MLRSRRLRLRRRGHSHREKCKWVRELIGTIDLARFADLAELRDELICQLFLAVVGTSRLPLHSVEAPLPGFSFGQLFYCHRESPGQASRTWEDLIDEVGRTDLNVLERAKLLETVLRDSPSSGFRSGDAVAVMAQRCPDLLGVLRQVFNEGIPPRRGQISSTTRCSFCGDLRRGAGRHLSKSSSFSSTFSAGWAGI